MAPPENRKNRNEINAKAAKNASVSAVAPKVRPVNTSRTKPVAVESRVKPATRAVDAPNRFHHQPFAVCTAAISDIVFSPHHIELAASPEPAAEMFDQFVQGALQKLPV